MSLHFREFSVIEMAEVCMLVSSVESFIFSLSSSLVRPTAYLPFECSIIEEICSVRGSAYSKIPDFDRRKFRALLDNLASDLDFAAYKDRASV